MNAASTPNFEMVAPAADGTAWDPGISSHVSRDLLALTTLFRSENGFRSLQEAIEPSCATGLPLEDFAVLRPSRLALHEVIIRITADFEIPDPEGANISSLGINFRRMTSAIASDPSMPDDNELTAVLTATRDELRGVINKEVRSLFGAEPAGSGPAGGGLWTRFVKRWTGDRQSDAPRDSAWVRDERAIAHLQVGATGSCETRAIACRALARVATGIRARHGRIPGHGEMLTPLVTDIACGELASIRIGQLLAPRIDAIAKALGFRRLPSTSEPVFMITKGASAAGKSTLRPLQRRLSARLGLAWSDFALVSPDIWRKALLDYGSLGTHAKYAGLFTSHEVALIDRKLDRHLVRKGDHGSTTNMLIDRFRFAVALQACDPKLLTSDPTQSTSAPRFLERNRFNTVGAWREA